MKNNRALLVFSFLLAVFLSSCKVQNVEMKGIDNIKVNQLNMQGIELELTATLKNPNNFGFKITGANLTGDLNGTTIGKVKLKNNVRIPKNSEKQHSFILTSGFGNLLAGGATSLMTFAAKGSQNVTVKGYVKARYFIFTKKFPVEFTKKLSLKDFMK